MEKHVLQEQLTLYNLTDPGGLIALQSRTAVNTQPCITKIKSFSVWNDVIHFKDSLEPSALHVVSVQYMHDILIYSFFFFTPSNIKNNVP